METLRTKFDVPVGLSDHTMDNLSSLVAASLGAVLIEKHFTVDRNLPGVDQSISMETAGVEKLKENLINVPKILGHEENKSNLPKFPLNNPPAVAWSQKWISGRDCIDHGNDFLQTPGNGNPSPRN